MTEQQAKKLVKSALEQPFEKGRFCILIKNLLNKMDEAKAFRPVGGSYISNAFKGYIKTLERLGQYKDPDGKVIDILIVRLKKESSLERARAAQRNYIARYLKEDRGRQFKDGALTAFVSPGGEDWRFSLIQIDYKFDESGKVKDVLTPARRYSFLVGGNEKSHTAQSCLLPLLRDDDKNPSLKDLERAFSVEKVTKEFFGKYRGLFHSLTDSLDKIIEKDKKIKADFKDKRVNSADFSKKLLGQIVFLYFLQKKGWFGVKRGEKWGAGSKHFLRELFNRRADIYKSQGQGSSKNFFNDVLEPLFYEALAKEHTGDYYSRFDCRIPFLNGGLFEPLGGYDWVNTDILLPDSVFSNKNQTTEGDTGDGILDIFDRYNFTVNEDEPLEKEVAVDPEMLGKVFENLLEVKDRKSKGTYYTPREIVHYMCQESLINYLAEGLKDRVKREDIERFIKISDYSESILPDKIKEHASFIDKKLADIRICDPAAGSGAFPVGMMSEIVRARRALTPFMPSENNPRTPYHFKRHAIEHCLYGADIDAGAIEIAKLRLWLSLVVDEEDRSKVQPLPNLDYKMVCGNSLLGLNRDDGSGTKDAFHDLSIKELHKKKNLYFNEISASKKQKYKQEIDQFIDKITENQKIFDFEVYFSEVFQEKQGFDIVIANPPYVKEGVNKAAFDGLRESPYYQGKMDIWYFFACKGIDILKPDSGIIAFIAQNNWVTSFGASKMRNKVIKDSQILNLIDFGNFKVFEAGIQTMIMLFQKNKNLKEYQFDLRRLRGKKLETKDMISILNIEPNYQIEENPKAEWLMPKIQRLNFLNQKLTFSNPEIENILNKMLSQAGFQLTNEEVGKAIEYNVDHIKQKHIASLYLTDQEVAQGVVFPQDFVNKKTQQNLFFQLTDEEAANGIHPHHDYVQKKHIKTLGSQYKIGDGVFVLSDKEKNSLPLTKKELSLIKPYYTTKELFRWSGNPKNKQWVIYTDSSFKDKKKIKEYPNIKKHLDQFKKIITSDNKPYGLHRARKESFFKGEKIIAARKCAQPVFSYVEFDSYVSATFYVIKSSRLNLKYLTALFNSKLTAFWLRHKGKMQGSNYQIDKEPLLAIPLVQPSENKQKPIIEAVDKILSIIQPSAADYLQNPAKQAKVQEYEKQIDQMVYKLYSLTPEEIKIIEQRR